MRLAAAALALLVSFGAASQPLPPAAPGDAGFSRDGLARIDRFFEREIAAHRVPGAVVAIARDGKLVYYKAFGTIDPATGAPMPLDAIFSLASMTKPMVAVSALTLTEQGLLPLKSRLDQYFPAFGKDKTVGLPAARGDANPEKAHPIYIQDLFRHTSGIAYGNRGDSPIHKLYPSGSAAAAVKYTGDEFIANVAPLPLLYQPGTVWEYSLAVDVLGLVVEKVAGERLDAFMRRALWGPLGMPDTRFVLDASQRARIAHAFPNNPLNGKPQHLELLEHTAKFDCAGGCAFGSVPDYIRFGQMLLDGGVLDGKRILSPKTVQLMTSDSLGANIKNNVADIEGHRDGYGFGLTVAVRTRAGVAAVPGSIGDYTWNGANGTAWWNDPAEHLVVAFGTAAPGELRKYYREQMADLVYGAMERSYIPAGERLGR
jgi:CubicO group peptidase (beta-lactamase class C family)